MSINTDVLLLLKEWERGADADFYASDIAALRQAIEQAEKPHPDHYAEVYIRVGDLHIKKVMTHIQYSQAYDPINLLSLMAEDCVQNLKETK